MNRNRFWTLALLSALASTTLVAGFTGWFEFYATETGWTRVTEAAYHTLLAFTGDGGYIGTNIFWIEFARFTGLLTTIAAALAVAAVFLGQQVSRVRASAEKRHTVVIGASDFAIDMARRGGAVTVFDTQEVLDTLSDRVRGKGVRLLAEPITEKTGLGWSLGRRPKKVIFGSTDTILNVARARYWLETIDPKRIAWTELAIRVENNAVARDLALLSPHLANATLISRADTVARALITAMEPTTLAKLRGQKRVHVLLVGLGSVNLAVAEELAMRCHHPDLAAVRVTVIDCDAYKARARLRAQRPDLENPDFGDIGFKIAFEEFDALECCAESLEGCLGRVETKLPLTAIVVAAGDDTVNAGIAMRLRQLQLEQLRLKAPIFMRNMAAASVAPAPVHDLTGGIIPFGGATLDSEDLELERIFEALARAVHDEWYENLPSERMEKEKPWDELPTVMRRSNYRAALSVTEFYHAAGVFPPAGAFLAGLRLEPETGRAILDDADQVHRLGRLEHDRWIAERRLEGYCCVRGGPRDDEKKLHPLMIPNDELEDLEARGILNKETQKDTANVAKALTLGIKRAENASAAEPWRKICRIGVIGPLETDQTRVQADVEKIVARLLATDPMLKRQALEILTPNTPGFDRIAAIELARAWQRAVGRPARFLYMQAARQRHLDDAAIEHILSAPLTDLDKDAVAPIRAAIEAQSAELKTFGDCGCAVRFIDKRGLGVSDTDLPPGSARYKTALLELQTDLMCLADHMIFDRPDALGSVSQDAVTTWRNMGRAPIFCGEITDQ